MVAGNKAEYEIEEVPTLNVSVPFPLYGTQIGEVPGHASVDPTAIVSDPIVVPVFG